MDDLIKLLDSNLTYIRHEVIDDICYIYVESTRHEVECPFCHHMSTRVHSRYPRSFQDLPAMGKKIIFILNNRKMFCDNPECSHTTFAERFDFLTNKAKKSNRLIKEITDISLNCSSIAAAQILRNGIADVGKSTICSMLKKKQNPK